MKIHTPSHRRTRHLHLAGTDPGERLVLLATTIEAALADDPDHPPTLVAAAGDGEEVELLLDPLHAHPAVELEGFVAPSSWWCLGVVAGGQARSLDAGPLPRPSRYPVHLAHLVARSGQVARVLRDRRSGAVSVQRPADDPGATDPDGGGVLDDYLRLALRLPTPPPAHPATLLHATMWIAQIRSEGAHRRLVDATWAEVAALHPVLDVTARSADLELGGWAIDHLVEAGELLAVGHPWAHVRALCRDGIGPFDGRVAELAGWLDDGAFARLVTAHLGPIEDHLADLHPLLRADVHARVVDTVAGWGLLGTPGADRPGPPGPGGPTP